MRQFLHLLHFSSNLALFHSSWCVCARVCDVSQVVAMARHIHTHKKGQLFARSPVLPESDNAAVVFIVFQGIEMKEERKKGEGRKKNTQLELQTV